MRGRSADPRLKSIDIGQKLYPAPRLPASLDETETFDSLSEMPPTWYVTFENRKRGILPKRRSPRETRTFATEDEAKVFARAKLDEGVCCFRRYNKSLSPEATHPVRPSLYLACREPIRTAAPS